MYDSPQISRRGEWGDVSAIPDTNGGAYYYCKLCGERFKTRKLDLIIEHYAKCKEDLKNKIKDKDYVVCKLCNFHGKSIKNHMTSLHKDINIKEYEKENGRLICSNSSQKYIDGIKSHDSWIKIARDRGEDLSEYWNKVSKGVKNAILSDGYEIKRRSKLMTDLNNKQQSDPEFQKKVKETAIKTSSRFDILQKRSEQLRKWRVEHPEDFFKKCVKKMITSYHTRPEKKLLEFLKTLTQFSFKTNQFAYSIGFCTKSKRKQIDFVDKINNIYIEFDGIYHFKPFRGEDALKQIQERDKSLDDYIQNNNYTLIRISYDQFVSKQNIVNCYFKQECLDKVVEILNNKITGIYRIGEMYGKY